MALMSGQFWVDAGERAIKTAAQMVLVVLGVGLLAGAQPGLEAQVVNVFALDWHTLTGVAAGGALVSILTSLASLGINRTGASMSKTTHDGEGSSTDLPSPR